MVRCRYEQSEREFHRVGDEAANELRRMHDDNHRLELELEAALGSAPRRCWRRAMHSAMKPGP